MDTKICKKCGKEYPEGNFPKRETGRGRPECKDCINAYNRLRYLEKVGKFKRDIRRDERESDPKKCIRCGELKPLSEYTIHNRKTGHHRNFCHDCEKKWISKYHKSPHGKETRKDWVDSNKEKIEEYKRFYKQDSVRQELSRVYHRARLLKEQFGMTVDDYMAMYEKQGGKCAICGMDKNGTRKNFCVDHNHETGKIRGLLCHNCNVSVGLMKDDPLLLRAAATYLETI
jgi:hypothetical protein